MVRSLLKASGVLEVLSDRPVSLAIPWSTRKRISVDVLGQAGDQMVVVEYDGSYYHGPDSARVKDEAKTLALLEAGYLVVRLRENTLPMLEIEHPRLVQTSFRYRMTLDEDLAAKELASILKWIEKSTQTAAS